MSLLHPSVQSVAFQLVMKIDLFLLVGREAAECVDFTIYGSENRVAMEDIPEDRVPLGV